MAKTKMFKFNIKNLKYSMANSTILFKASGTGLTYGLTDFNDATIIIDGELIVKDGVLINEDWTLVLNTTPNCVKLTATGKVFSITNTGVLTLTGLNYALVTLVPVKELAYANSISLEANYSESKLFGDGEVLGVLGNDKGKTGTISVVNIEDHYERDCGRLLTVHNAYADIQQRQSNEHYIYYETEAYEEGQVITIKNWLFGCVTGKASESYEQTTEDPVINNYEYALTVLGENLKNEDGSDNVDDNGNTTKIFRMTSFPEDDGYTDFGDYIKMPIKRGGA